MAPGHRSATMNSPEASVLVDPLSLANLLTLSRRYWLLLTASALAAAGGAAVVAFSLTPVYRAEVVLLPNEVSAAGGGLAQLVGGMGALGSLAGISLPGGSSMRVESIATLNSRALTEAFIRSRNLLPVLYSRDWNSDMKAWATDDPPTLAGAVEDFNEDVRFVIEDRRTGLVTLRIEWTDPNLAARWANEFVAAANEAARRRVIDEANSTLRYLNAELGKTSVVGVQQGIYSLIETQINTIAMANVQEEYAFRVVDPAVPAEPDRFVRPMRPLIIVLGAIVGFGLTLLVLLIRTSAPGLRELTHDN